VLSASLGAAAAAAARGSAAAASINASDEVTAASLGTPGKKTPVPLLLLLLATAAVAAVATAAAAAAGAFGEPVLLLPGLLLGQYAGALTFSFNRLQHCTKIAFILTQVVIVAEGQPWC
jgi:fatty acid desaturase